MKKKFVKALALIALMALAASATTALGEEALVELGEAVPAELGETDLLDPAIYSGDYAEQEVNVGAPNAVYIPGSESGAPVAPEANGVLGVTVTNVTIRASETFQTRVSFDAPYGGYMYCASSNTAVMQCGWSQQYDGNADTLNIYGVAAGTATVTITNSLNSERVYIYVTVRPVIELASGAVTVNAGKTVAVDVYFPGYNYVYYYNDNTGVCACRWDSTWTSEKIKLFITGVSAGTATVKITNSYNDDTCWLKVTVPGPTYKKKGRKDGKQECRALLVGEGAFKEQSTRLRADATRMEKALKTVKGPSGGKWKTTKRFDLDHAGLKKAIYNAFKQADEDDVSLLFISTHGDAGSTGRDAGMLSLIPEGQEYMRFEDLAGVLKAVPGKVIVLLTSCGSGACVFTTHAKENAARDAWKEAAKAFDHAAIEAFSDADPGVGATEASGMSGMGDDVANTGELRVKNKFYVLTAARYQELGWGDEQRQYTYFTKWLTDGIGSSGRMPADENKDSRVTLNEMFKYISKVGDHVGFRSEGKICYEHVQVYPKNSNFGLFSR